MGVTLDDIARVAECSRSAVSNILARGDVRYSRRLRARVAEVARELGYVPNGPARSLITGRSQAIGFVGANWNDPHLFQALSAAGEIVARHRHQLMLSAVTGKTDWCLMLKNRRADLVIPFAGEPDAISVPPELAPWRDRIVSFGWQEDRPKFCRYSVVWSVREEARLVADHLGGLNHRRIAVLSGDYISLRTAVFARCWRERGVEPLILVCPDAGNPMAPDGGLALLGDYPQDRILVTEGADGATQLRAALDRDMATSAVFARNDQIAAEALEAANAMGIATPGRLSVVGSGDYAAGFSCGPRLTSIVPPLTAAIRLILDDYFAALEEKRPQRSEDIQLPVTLHVGQTTGPARPD